MTAFQKWLEKLQDWFKPQPRLVLPPNTSLLSLSEFTPSGFVNGIEILNDEQTPMQFVIGVLENHVGLDQTTALKTMLLIHSKGGVLLPFARLEEAERVAAAITELSAQQHHPLICRAVSAQ